MRDPLATVADIHAGRADAGVAVAEALEVIAARNPTLNAIIGHDPGLVAPQLAHLRARLAAGERPPLAGLPVSVKDHIAVEGWPLTEGSALLRDRVAPRDEIAVARLRVAGAILIGRSNMSEFGCKGVTTNLAYGATRHHLDARLTPGGSSGGAAVATATGMCALALAGDGGGSVRRPAAHAGVVGFKPSGGAVPNAAGPSPVAVIGMMARSVELIARAFEAIAGPHPADPVAVGLPAALRPVQALRLGWAPTLGLDVPVDAAAMAAGVAAVDRIAAAGFRIIPCQPTWPEDAGEEGLMPLQHAGLALAWGAEWRRRPEAFDPDIAAQIEAGLRLTGTEVMAADRLSRAIAQAAAFFADGPDLLLALTTPCPAWPLDRLGPERIGGQPVGPRAHAALTPFANHAFLPAISLPCGTTPDGLPLGLQILGPRLSDATLLAVAEALAPIIAA